MKFIVTNSTEAQDVLEYFAALHGACIQTLTFSTRYEATPTGTNLIPGFDVAITFWHSGYANYNPPTRRILTEFLDASHFRLDVEKLEGIEFQVSQAWIDPAVDGAFAFGIDFARYEGQSPVEERKPLLRFKRALFTEL